jgi:two-component system response regulator HydG
LLGAVEEKRIQPLGNGRPVDLDVRIIAATNVNIRKAVEERRFREDLFYRLGEFMISLPPLRERREDIALLAGKFLSEAAEDMSKPMLGISDEALSVLRNHRWSGNIRELKNVVRRAVLLSEDRLIQPRHLQFLLEGPVAGYAAQTEEPAAVGLPSLSLPELERIAIREALEASGGNKTRAASLLDIDYRTLLRKLKSATA